MKTTLYSIPILVSLCSACATADSRYASNTQYMSIEAPVVSVSPLVQTITEKIPHRNCWDETVRVQSSSRHHAAAPTVLGAIIGGVAGGAIGKNNRHQPLLAGAGAVLGAAVAHDSTHKRSSHSRYVTEERCEVNYELRDVEQVTGYRVGYQYGDTIYYTRTETDPGDTIRLNVSVKPTL